MITSNSSKVSKVGNQEVKKNCSLTNRPTVKKYYINDHFLEEPSQKIRSLSEIAAEKIKSQHNLAPRRMDGLKDISNYRAVLLLKNNCIRI